MELNETASYIAGRIRIAGGRPEQVFTREAVAAVFQSSSGLPRTVNVICDNALIGGFAAQVKPINAAFVEEVCRDFDIHAGSPEAISSLEDLGSATVESADVVPPRIPALASGQAPPLAPSGTPMTGETEKKRRFSFF
jgi:general secretion pathway protein A